MAASINGLSPLLFGVDVGFGPAHQDFNGFHGSEASASVRPVWPPGCWRPFRASKVTEDCLGCHAAPPQKIVNAGMSYSVKAENAAKQRPNVLLK
jgi:hypothetical protein